MSSGSGRTPRVTTNACGGGQLGYTTKRSRCRARCRPRCCSSIENRRRFPRPRRKSGRTCSMRRPEARRRSSSPRGFERWPPWPAPASPAGRSYPGSPSKDPVIADAYIRDTRLHADHRLARRLGGRALRRLKPGRARRHIDIDRQDDRRTEKRDVERKRQRQTKRNGSHYHLHIRADLSGAPLSCATRPLAVLPASPTASTGGWITLKAQRGARDARIVSTLATLIAALPACAISGRNHQAVERTDGRVQGRLVIGEGRAREGPQAVLVLPMAKVWEPVIVA